MGFLDTTFYNNLFWEWLLGIGIVIVVFLGLRITVRLVLRRVSATAKKTKNDVLDFVAGILRRTKSIFLLLIALFFGSQVLTLPATASRLLAALAVIAASLQVAFWGNSLITFLIGRYTRRKLEEDADTATTVSALGFIAKLFLWVAVLLIALDNLGFDITALITGLGIGGIAVALALQNVLSDLLASLSIVLDKPFVIGDFVIVDDLMGTVEKVGLKTTRIKSLHGEQLVFSNNDLLASRIRNYKKMTERRIVFGLGITYETPYAKVQAIPRIIEEIITSRANTRFDRAHFKAYGDFSLDFEIVYYVLKPDYSSYMDVQQEINLQLFRKFEEEGIGFAYPTQTLYLPGYNNEDDTEQ